MPAGSAWVMAANFRNNQETSLRHIGIVKLEQARQKTQRKAHCHAMIVVGINSRIRHQFPGGRRDLQKIVPFLRLFAAEFAQFLRHGCNTIGFLYAPTRDIPENGVSRANKAVTASVIAASRNMVTVQIDCSQATGSGSTCFDPVIAKSDIRSICPSASAKRMSPGHYHVLCLRRVRALSR